MTWTPDELVTFLAKVLYEVAEGGLTLDYAFQKVKRRWRPLESFKVFYDASFDAVRHFFFLKFAASRLFGHFSYRTAAKAWFIYRADALLYNKDVVARFKKKLLKRAVKKPEEVLAEVEALSDAVAYLSVKYSYHPSIVEALLRRFPREEAERILAEGNKTWIWLRINTLKADVDKALKMLEAEAEVEPHPKIPFALLVKRAARPVQYLTAVRSFVAVPQDLASIYAVLSLDPRPGESIIDLAAAPGMKTSLIAQLTEGRAKIVAVDVSAKRVDRMRRLLKLLGAGEYVEVIRADSRRLAAPRRFDKALLDAPCTSSGAFTKEPAVKIYPRLWEADRYSALQTQLLKNALELAEEVTYAVCSILPQEGEEVVKKAAARAEKPHPDLLPSYEEGLGGRTFPHVHKSEAFFISKIRH
ncbi:MAG: RsmB/NOP family class I SAM-dependent RNA methyltransferase [Pyrobaculum sp.]